MNTVSIQSRKTLQVFSGRAYPDLAEEIVKYLDVSLTPQSAYEFANGEIFVRFEESVRGADAFVVQSCGHGINTWVMETLIMIDALKRASADRITVVLPFYPYARQDKKHRGREPISARLISDLLHTAGADRLMTVDLHTDQTQGFFDGPVDHLFAMRLLGDYIADKYKGEEITVVSPDSGRVRLSERWADRLGGTPVAFIHKTRDPRMPNTVVTNRVVGDVEGRTCLLVDDMIDTGGTITKAATKLFEQGAKDVVIAATHGILSDPATERLRDCGATEIILTNTLPIPAERLLPNMTVLSIAPLIAQAIHEVFEDGSVTSLFSADEG
ncbi:ribose-phosphate diphosphokinase [Kineosporia rhizophila]|uniref:ribose-phosphate diphosphokinase n=1 Tax=Kineosporia TaxID=49184 RepID=UPI000B20EFAA|nr:ribose-phosphate diphosphokinase [Kineosporia sp. NBRC 101677]MCE0537284.1 ribose-phosphate diphosphokinase [Kineosporia rhizophila]GLY17572.1 ribose-phosphate pyrophosphokinase [Kineosporia sp. NBRC 101677]